MTSKEVSDLKQIIASSITGNSGDTSDMLPLIDGEHSYYTEDFVTTPDVKKLFFKYDKNAKNVSISTVGRL